VEVGQLVGRHRVGQVIANLAIGLTWPPARTVPGVVADADNRDRVADRG
jgi:hypothetical protein